MQNIKPAKVMGAEIRTRKNYLGVQGKNKLGNKKRMELTHRNKQTP
jgi:hypothetical protein